MMRTTGRRKKERKKGDGGDKDGSGNGSQEDYAEEATTAEEYLKRRCFLFIHHFAGKDDPLEAAVREAAALKNLKVTVLSVDIENGAGDLSEDEPYLGHLKMARAGLVDGYHAGFPCTTFTRLKFREAEGYPGPVRTATYPYGVPGLTEKRKEQCDKGTVFASRSAKMATAVLEAPRETSIKPCSTLENPPPSDVGGHLSAWELPEVAQFLKKDRVNIVQFCTCAYQTDVDPKERFFKPQMMAGALLGHLSLDRTCRCGILPKEHKAVVGKALSAKSAEYPKLFCQKYAALLMENFQKMGRQEFLQKKMTSLAKTVAESKEEQKKRKAAFDKEEKPSKSEKKETAKERRESVKDEIAEDPGSEADFGSSGSSLSVRVYKHPDGELCVNTGGEATSSGLKRKDRREKEDSPRKVSKENTRGDERSWKPGEGAHGAVKESKKKTENPGQLDFVGGMRDPLKVIEGMPSLLNLGLKLWKEWNAFLETEGEEALRVAEDYGSSVCRFNQKYVAKWKDRIKELVGAGEAATTTLRARHEYVSPLDPELIEAWTRRSGDPDTSVAQWVREGAPLGINLDIETRGIFPTNVDDDVPDVDLPHAAEQIDKGRSTTNYVSVTEQEDEARIELNRYKEKGYMVEVSEEEVRKYYGRGTISKLALIVKTKESGEKKRRIIIDLKRSTGNLKARLPERLILPRPSDAMGMMRGMVLQSLQRGDEKVPPKERWNRELVVIDISDAYMSLGVHPKEHEHCLAPGLDSDYVMFVAMLFGFKTAPLVWSRVAAWLSRLLQATTPVEFAQHQTYLDDQLWMLQGSLQQRNEVLGVILLTMAALGFKVNVRKGERGSNVVWIGVKFTLQGETLLMTLPQKFMEELATTLKEAKSRGMLGTSEVRKIAGKVSWLAGVLPRARWAAAALYAAMHAHLREVERGEETKRRSERKDKRVKDNLIPVKRFAGRS